MLPFRMVSVDLVASDLQSLVVLVAIIDVLCVRDDLVGDAQLLEKVHHVGA